MTLTAALAGLLIFPGLLYAVPAGWLMKWIDRKLEARLQHRIGPPFFQPFFDFVKLMAKEPIARPTLQGLMMTAMPLLSIASLLGTIALLPVFPENPGFTGDLILLVGLIEVAPICAVLAGFASRSLYGQIGSAREAVLALAYNLPFLTALFALVVASGSFSLAGIVSAPMWFVRVPALIALAMTLPVKLHLNPFSTASAEQEIYAGSITEYDGPRLGLWQLSHALEWVALTGLFAVLLWPALHVNALVRVAIFVVTSLAIVAILATIAASTARLKMEQVAKFYWLWGFGISLVALVVAFIQR